MSNEEIDCVSGTTGVMFGPLSFPSPDETISSGSFHFDWSEDEDVSCLLCNTAFAIPNNSKAMFEHLFREHRLVIGETDRIASLKSYLKFWRVRFSSHRLEEFCTTLTMDVKPDGTPSKNESYFLLADNLPEDKELRDGLQKQRLEYVLDVQEKERIDPSFCRGCLFCRLEVTTSRSDYLGHLAVQHNLQLGKPQNLVFIDQLLDTIQAKINSLECLYCDKLFKDRNVLKEHMRKKQHKRINPENAAYDKFYVVNYLEMGKTWVNLQNEPDLEVEAPTASDWDDWQSDQSEAPVVCLFCPTTDKSYLGILLHMTEKHNFHFKQECQRLTLDFYQQVKVVNFIRRQVHCLCCLNCDVHCDNAALLLAHMTECEHLSIPSADAWNQPEFYFPTFENDSFLCHLEEEEEEEEADVEKADQS